MFGLLDGIKNFNKRNLKDVVTVEKNIVEIKTEPTKKPKGHYSYHMSHTDEEDSIEWFEIPAKLRQKCKKLAQLIKTSKHVVIYTGAGISTSAKLPDYRGSDGMWTVKDKGSNHQKNYVSTISDALPTLAHFAIAEMTKRGFIKYVVSTNVDGLHMRSGLKRNEELAELHGNSYLECCNKCGKEYLRGKDILQNQTTDHRAVNRHWCGAVCEEENCDGLLLDTIVAFGENLPEDQYKNAYNQSKKGDLAIVLGSTMMVQPACILPSLIYENNNGKMVICNLQNTPYDDDAHFLIHAYIDDIFYLLLQELEISIPDQYQLYDQTSFPSSFLDYHFNADQIYPEKLTEAKKRLEQIKREKLENTPKGNAITRGENPYKKSVISNATNENLDVHFESIELAFISNCQNCRYKIEDKTKKIVIENCKNLTLEINGKILTNVLEIINCFDIHLIVNTSIFTITCDNTKKVDIFYPIPDHFQMIAWAKVENPKVVIGDQELDLSLFDKINIDQDQVITKKLDNGEFQSSITQRDSCGRITQLIPK